MGGDSTHCCQVVNVKLLALLLLLVLLTGRIVPLTDIAFRSVGRFDRSAVSNWWLNEKESDLRNHTCNLETIKADSHIACRAHAVPLPCRAAKDLECIFPIWFTQCGRVWFTLAMPRLCHALTMPFFSRLRHSTAVERRPVGYLPAFGFFWLPRGVPRRLSEAYQSSSRRSIPATVKSGTSTLQKGQSVKLLD
jgi:hypothetical protein